MASFASCSSKRDDVGVGAEEARHLVGQFGVERLVDGGEHTAHQQARDQVLGANFELLRQILYADAFGDRDVARDRQRLVAKATAETRRRREALHRAFFGLRGYRCPPRRARLPRDAAGAEPRRSAERRRHRTCPNAGTRRRSRDVRQSRDVRRTPGREACGRRACGCLGRGPPGNCPGGAHRPACAAGAIRDAPRAPAIEDRLAALNACGRCAGGAVALAARCGAL